MLRLLQPWWYTVKNKSCVHAQCCLEYDFLKKFSRQITFKTLLLLFSCSVMSDSLRPHRLQTCQTSLSFTNSWGLLNLMSVESVMPSNHLILCRPLLLTSIFPSIRIFSNESALSIKWPKYWSFSFSISPSSEYSGLISFSIDWFDLAA